MKTKILYFQRFSWEGEWEGWLGEGKAGKRVSGAAAKAELFERQQIVQTN